MAGATGAVVVVEEEESPVVGLLLLPPAASSDLSLSFFSGRKRREWKWVETLMRMSIEWWLGAGGRSVDGPDGAEADFDDGFLLVYVSRNLVRMGPVSTSL